MNIKTIKTLPGHCERRTKNDHASPERSAQARERRTGGRQSAFTLIELLITIVLAGMILLALIMGFHESLKSMETQKDILSANLLCEDLMNEIRSKKFVDPVATNSFGRETGETNRSQFNDVDDYDDWPETPPQTVEGSSLPNCVGFTRRVSVVNVSNVSDWAAPTTNSTDFKRITVVVSNAQMSVSNVSVVSRYD
jgi:MSHA pilin protein MshD